jgi:hypothetical protein
MTITYRDTKGEDLDPFEVDANFRHVLDSANGTFVQSGIGQIPESQQSRGRWWKLITDGLSETKRAALVAGSTVDITTELLTELTNFPWLEFPQGSYSFTATVDLPSAADYRFRAMGGGTVTFTTASALSGGGIIRQQNRGGTFTCEGINFSGKTPAFKYLAGDLPAGPLPFATQYKEYKFVRCKFLQDATSYFVHLYGSREGDFLLCDFETGNGVYAQYAIEPRFYFCDWKNCARNIYLDTGCEGLKVFGGSSLGATIGLETVQNAGVQLIGILWDYADQNIVFRGTTDVVITGSYLGTRTSNPPVECLIVNAVRCSGFTITGNTITNNYNNATSYNLILSNLDDSTISGNRVWNWQANGIQYTDCSGLVIADNNIKPKAATGSSAIFCNSGDSATNSIKNNRVGKPISVVSAKVSGNNGHVTENNGSGTITSGNTAVTITHGLAVTPAARNISITPTATTTTDPGNLWVDTITSTQFNVNCRTNPGASGMAFDWQATVL